MSRPSDDYYYRFYYDKFWGSPSVWRMSYFAQNLYWRLLDLQLRGETVPADIKTLATTLGVHRQHIEKYFPEIAANFEVQDGCLVNRRATSELVDRANTYEEKAAAGAVGGAAPRRPKEEKAAPIPAPRPEPPVTKKAEPETTRVEPPTKHPLAKAWREQYNRYATLSKMTLDSSALSKWLQLCSELVTTDEALQQLVYALDALKAECEAEPAKRGMLRYPPYFLRDDRPGKGGEQQWLAYASNVEAAHQAAEKSRPMPFEVEIVPWQQPMYGESEARKQQLRDRWPEETRRRWIQERLSRIPPQYHAAWYQQHDLTPLEDAQPAA